MWVTRTHIYTQIIHTCTATAHTHTTQTVFNIFYSIRLNLIVYETETVSAHKREKSAYLSIWLMLCRAHRLHSHRVPSGINCTWHMHRHWVGTCSWFSYLFATMLLAAMLYWFWRIYALQPLCAHILCGSTMDSLANIVCVCGVWFNLISPNTFSLFIKANHQRN